MNNKAMVKWLVRIGSVTFVAAVIGGISVLGSSAQKQTDPAQASLSADRSPATSQKSLLPHVKSSPPQERGHWWRGHFKRNDHVVYEDDNDDNDDDDHDDDRDEHERDHDEDEDDWLWEIVPGHDSQTDTRTKAS